MQVNNVSDAREEIAQQVIESELELATSGEVQQPDPGTDVALSSYLARWSARRPISHSASVNARRIETMRSTARSAPFARAANVGVNASAEIINSITERVQRGEGAKVALAAIHGAALGLQRRTAVLARVIDAPFAQHLRAPEAGDNDPLASAESIVAALEAMSALTEQLFSTLSVARQGNASVLRAVTALSRAANTESLGDGDYATVVAQMASVDVGAMMQIADRDTADYNESLVEAKGEIEALK